MRVPRAVLLFQRHHVAGAHRTAVQLAAGSEPDASRGGIGEGAAILNKLEMRLRLQRFVVRTQPQILRGQIGIHYLMRIQFVLRIPDRLELAEGVHQFRTEHLGQQSAARLPVAVLAGERTSIADDQVGCPFDKLAILADARLRSASQS